MQEQHAMSGRNEGIPGQAPAEVCTGQAKPLATDRRDSTDVTVTDSPCNQPIADAVASEAIPVEQSKNTRIDSPQQTQQTLYSPSQQPTVTALASDSMGMDDDDSDSEGGKGRRSNARCMKPHLQGRFSGRLATKDDEKRLSEECRLLAPLLGGVGKRGDRSRMTLAKIVRGIATGDVRRHLEAREMAHQVITQQLAAVQSGSGATSSSVNPTPANAVPAAAQQQIRNLHAQVAALKQQLAIKERQMQQLQAASKETTPSELSNPGPQTLAHAPTTTLMPQTSHFQNLDQVQPGVIQLQDLPVHIANQLLSGHAVTLPAGYQTTNQGFAHAPSTNHYMSDTQADPHHQQVYVMQPNDQMVTLPQDGLHMHSTVQHQPAIMNAQQFNGSGGGGHLPLNGNSSQYVTINNSSLALQQPMFANQPLYHMHVPLPMHV